MHVMETLGLSDSSTRSESRLKTLFWPSIENAYDVDYLGVQGYWVCTVVAFTSFVFLVLTAQPIMATVVLLLYYFGGVGVREGSRYAAAVVFAMYALDSLMSFSVIRVLFAALLLSNLRATWIASRWKAGSEEATSPPRLSETWADKFADALPAWLWPKTRILYYILSGTFLVFLVFGITVILMHKVPTAMH